MSFVHLRVHSNYSMLAGTAPVEELVEAAVRMGMPALALTDTDGLYAVVPFQRACAAAGIRPVYGVELTGKDGVVRVTLLARNRRGYAEISRLVTARRLDDGFSLAEALDGVSENCYILSGDEMVLRRLGGRKSLLVALPVAPGREWDRKRWRLRRGAALLGARTVAVGDVYFTEPGGHFIHRVLTAVRTRTTVGTLPPDAAAPPSAYLHSPADVERVFLDDPVSVRRALEVAADCRVELGLGKKILPRFSLPRGEDAAGMLRRLAVRGLHYRMNGEAPDSNEWEQAGKGGGDSAPPASNGNGWSEGSTTDDAATPPTMNTSGWSEGVAQVEWRRAIETLEYELSVVEGKGLAAYFLICWDIVRFASSRGLRSLGRGSAGNSILSYALGITHVNPLRHNLFFERFLNPEREKLPDFDIDFATDDREVVLEYIFRRYGRDRVAMIGTFSTLRARAALRETAKALGIPEGEIASFIKRIPYHASVEHLEEACAVSPAAAEIPLDREPFRTLLPLAAKIGGFPRHMATHPCGLVISPDPITDLVPLQRGDKGYEITQWSMHEIEDAGLVKIDIIGQKGLAVIQETAQMAAENEGRPLHPERIDYLDDPATRRTLREGRSEGCFYIESPGMIQLIRQARCDDFEVLTALSSIIRPGVSSYGGKQTYLRRHLGLEEEQALHPSVAEVLGDTYGCLIYQEQVIRIAVAVAGMSYAEADGLRRCMSFKNAGDESFESYRASFMRGAQGRGVPEETAREVFRQIASFAGYAFCKAHSASFALESFESLYWKTHYPAEFMAAVLSNGGGYYSQEEYLEEARRIGLEILPPCVNESRLRHHGRGGTLRIGLIQVGGLTTETADRIVERRPYQSLAEFMERVHAAVDEVESLIRCGAMSCFGRTSAELLWELRLLRAGAERTVQIPHISENDLPRRVALEREVLGVAVSAHPLAMFEHELSAVRNARCLARSVDLPRCVGRDVELVGWKVTVKGARTMTRGEAMVFVTFSDQWGRFEATFFPKVYRRTARELVRSRGPFLVRGRVESELGVESLVAGDLCLINGDNTAVPHARS